MLRDTAPTPRLVLLTALLVVAVMHAVGAGSALAQSAPLLGESMDTVAPVVHESSGGPFAVQSSGRPARRPPRTVVVLPDTAAARSRAAALSAPPAPAPAAPRAAATSPPPPRTAGPAADGAPRTHRVEWGETWLGIARQHSVTARELSAANPGVDPERLRSGTVLRIPRPAADGAPRRTHLVRSGDTLFGIARRYGVSADAIRLANQLGDAVIRIGQTLVIPPEERP